MRNYEDDEDDHDYSPNELAHLSINHKEKYDKIVRQNLEEGDAVEKWEQRNLDRAKIFMNRQRHG